MAKLPAKYNVVAFPFALSVIMSCVVSLISTLKAFGFSEFQIGNWMQAWGLSWLVAFPTVLLVLPVVRRIVGLVVEKP
jgi:Protein of unknown function (DUF2798)